jgi:hypothetical protein
MRFLRTIINNPLLVRELRRRMRGKVLVFSLMIYVSVLCAVAYLIIYFMTKTIPSLTSGMTQQFIMLLSSIGKTIYWATMAIQGLLVMIIAPTLTASIVPMEREKKTFEFIQVTIITPGSFVLGCLMSTALYALLLMACSLPVVSLAFLYGGVSPGDVLRAFGFMLLVSITLSSIGMLVSSTRERTRGAIGGMIGLLFLLYFLLNAAFQFIMHFTRGRTGIGSWFRAPFAATFYGFHVPWWAVAATLCVLLTIGALTVAARKLYDPSNRTFSFRQMFIAFAIILVILLGFTWERFNNDNVAIYLFATAAVILGAITNCSVGDRRIGDEQWRLKKKHPSLRSRDEGFWCPVALIAIWLVSVEIWRIIAVQRSQALMLYLPAIMLMFCAFFLFTIVIARLISLYVSDRRAMARALLIFVLALAALPTLSLTLIRFQSRIPEPILRTLAGLSPVAVTAEYMESALNPAATPKPDIFGFPPGYLSIVLYSVGTVVLGRLNIVLRKKKIKIPAYYYEL